MKLQRGVSLNGLLIGSVIFGLVALLAMKVLPEWMEYGKIVKVVKATANDGNLKEASIADVRAAYDKRADIDLIKSVTGQDLDITKENGDFSISFAYAKKVPIYNKIRLEIDYKKNSAAK